MILAISDGNVAMHEPVPTFREDILNVIMQGDEVVIMRMQCMVTPDGEGNTITLLVGDKVLSLDGIIWDIHTAEGIYNMRLPLTRNIVWHGYWLGGPMNIRDTNRDSISRMLEPIPTNTPIVMEINSKPHIGMPKSGLTCVQEDVVLFMFTPDELDLLYNTLGYVAIYAVDNIHLMYRPFHGGRYLEGNIAYDIYIRKMGTRYTLSPDPEDAIETIRVKGIIEVDEFSRLYDIRKYLSKYEVQPMMTHIPRAFEDVEIHTHS